jgi:hypothetical protein
MDDSVFKIMQELEEGNHYHEVNAKAMEEFVNDAASKKGELI